MKHETSVQPVDPADIVFTLNKNAAKVSKHIKRIIHHYLPGSEVYLSNTQAEAEENIKTILKQPYKHIFTGGGDGTTYHLLNLLRKHGNKNLHDYPGIGLLGLGTGNGLASEVNAQQLDYVLSKTRRGDLTKSKEYNLIETEAGLVHFSTLGLDAQVLTDFIEVKKQAFFKQKYMSLPAYVYAYATRTCKSDALINPWKVRIINEGKQVYTISHSKKPQLLPIKKGETIYEGPCNVAGVGTASNYGFKFKVFPYARAMRNFMNLRMVNISNYEFLKSSYNLWRGTYENESVIKDFLVQKVRLQFSQAIPFQTGGDPHGVRDEITYEVSDQKVKLLDFS